MPHRIANATGNIDSATLWETGTNTPTIHASTNITINTTDRFSATFTAPNTTDACTGIILYMVDNTVDDLRITLQESTVDTAATATVIPANIPNSSFFYVRFATPHTFTTTAAGAYRFKMDSTAGAGSLAADSGGSNFAYLATDSRAGVLATTDSLWVAGQNGTTDVIVTVNTDTTTGSGADVNSVPSIRSWGAGVNILPRGKLTWSTSTSANLTVNKGHVMVWPGGVFERGTVASPQPSGVIAKMTFDQNAVAGNYGFRVADTGQYIDQGTPKPDTTNWKANYVSGAGTTASPITVPSGWAVGDHFVVTAELYSEIEYKYIISKPTATTAIVSDTSGGVESGLTYTHLVTDEILNLERNVITTTTDNRYGWFFYGGSLTDGHINTDWSRYEFTGSTTSSRGGFTAAILANAYAQVDYAVFWRPRYAGLVLQTTKRPLTFTGNITAGENTSNTSTIGGILGQSSANNKTYNDCYCIGLRRVGAYFSAIANVTLNRCKIIGCNTVNGALSGGVYLVNANLVNLNNCEVQANRVSGMVLGGAAGGSAVNTLFGSRGDNTTDVICLIDTYNEYLYDNCLLSSTTRISGYADTIVGSIIKFNKLDQIENNHTWYTANGQGRSTGAGLSDTVVKTAGSLGVRLAPETSDGIRHEYKVLARPDSAVSALGFVRMNTTFTGDPNTVLTVNLYLPGSTTADDTVTITKTPDEWLVYNLAANYTGDVTAYATVEVLATNPDAIASAYAYHDDIFNGTNLITAVDVWDEGQPSEIMFEQLGDASAIWSVSTSTFTTSGTVGYLMNKLLTVGKFLGLK